MKKISIFLVLTALVICLFAEDFMQPTGPDKSLTSPRDASGYLYSSTREAPAYEFIIDPTTIITSYYDYMPGSYWGLPLRIQPETSQPSGYPAGGAYVVFHTQETTTATRRLYYAYIDADGNVTATNPVSTNDVRQGYPGIDIDPVTADPFVAWHAKVEPDDSYDVLSSYDLYHSTGSPGLWIDEFISIDNPEVGEPLTGFGDNEFLWPLVYISDTSPLGGDYRRVYVTGSNYTYSHGALNLNSQNAILGYADFNTADLDAQSTLNWTYRTMAQMDAWNAEDPICMRPFNGCATADDMVAYAGYVINADSTVIDAFVLLNENYGEGPFEYYSSNFIFPQWNPMYEDSSGYLYSDPGTPMTPYIVSQSFLYTHHMNIQFKDNNTKITWTGAMAITFDALDGNGPGHYYPVWCQFYPKEVVFDLSTHEFSFKDLYIEGANPYDNIPMIPWDLDEDGIVDSFDLDGCPEWVYNWPVHWPVIGDAYHENTFKTAVNGNWIVSVWSDGTKAKRFYNGDPSFSAWEAVPEVAIVISADHGATWSEPIFLNANDTPELVNQIPCYVYPGDVIEIISNTPGNYHGKVHLFYFDDNDFGSFILLGNGLENGGQIMYAALDIEFPAEWVPGSSLFAAFFATPTSGVEPLTVNFTDLSIGDPTTWEWDFQNDGTIDSYEQNPTWIYNDTGLYTVSLTVSDGSTSDTETKPDYIDMCVNIPDANFKAAINGYLGQPAGYNPTVADLNGITGIFDASYSNISSIEGAQYLTNLTMLILHDNQISDISAVSGLTNLTRLELGSNQISDISAVSGLTNLIDVRLYNNQINDISAVSGLTNLVELILYSNQISDISAVSGLTNLTLLELGDNQISDISTVSGLTNLTGLYLRLNQISDISAVSGLTNLTNLRLYNNQISDISAVSGLTNLTGLELYNNQISDISAVSGLTNLIELWLGINQISDISSVSGLTNLNELHLQNNQISDISAVSGLTNLNDLRLYSNQISDISAISGLTNLTYLHLGNNQNSDISAVSGLTNLTSLHLANNQISDISAVSGLTNLTGLYLGNNQISDISAVSGLTNLTELWLCNNQISNISAVSGLTNLTGLWLHINQISDISAVSGLTNLTELWLGNNQISDISAVSGLTNLTILYLYNNQISDISAVSGLTNLSMLALDENEISDIYALVENTGLGLGDTLYLEYQGEANPLSQEALNVHIPILLSRGFDIFTYPSIPNNYAACYPNPSRNETGVSPNADLEWRGNFPSRDAVYDVWLGETDENLVNVGNGTAINDTLYSFTPTLNPYTDYWWKVRAVTETDTIWSGLWHFITAEYTLQHFIPCYTGNGYNNMTFFINSATIDGFNMESGDEIGIFDGDICVGAGVLTSEIPPVFQMVSSADDPTTGEIDGFISGNPIIYKLWDSSEAAEITYVIPTYTLGDGTFLQLGTAMVDLEGFSYVEQTTGLLSGWNMISFYNEPDNMDIQAIMQALIDAGELYKVQDEGGLALVYLPGIGWYNGIGDMATTEGYYIKVLANTQLYTIGSFVSLPKDIPLITGWNMMSYPVMTSQDGLVVVQSLINTGYLFKVQNESGFAIVYLPGIGWYNGIGDFLPGEGYYIKVNSDTTLTINQPVYYVMKGIEQCSRTKKHIKPFRETTHFNPVWDNNPYMAMNVFVSSIEIEELTIESGDEIGIYDGEICVGSTVIENGEVISLIASTDDPITEEIDGFTVGNEMSFRFWDSSENIEMGDIDVTVISGDETFASLGTSVLCLEIMTTGISDNLIPTVTELGKNYPNPFNPTTTINFSMKESGHITLEIYNIKGQIVRTLINEFRKAGYHKAIWDGTDDNRNPVSSGIYLCKMNEGNQIMLKKMLLVK